MITCSRPRDPPGAAIGFSREGRVGTDQENCLVHRTRTMLKQARLSASIATDDGKGRCPTSERAGVVPQRLRGASSLHAPID